MAKIRKSLCVILSLVIALSSITAFAKDNITVKLNGKEIAFDVPPQIINGVIMVPMLKTFEAIGASVEWDDATKTAIATNGNRKVKTTLNSRFIGINDTSLIEMDCAPTIIYGSIMIPTLFVAMAFGYTVNWDDNENVVYIYTDTVNDIMWNATCNYNDGLYYEGLAELNSLSSYKLSSEEKTELEILENKINSALNDQPDILSRIKKIQDYLNMEQYFEAGSELYALNTQYPSLPPSENNIVWDIKIRLKNGFSKLAKNDCKNIVNNINNGLYYEARRLIEQVFYTYQIGGYYMLNDDVIATLSNYRNEAVDKLIAYQNSVKNSHSIYESIFGTTEYRDCPSCRGSGKIMCNHCEGTGVTGWLYKESCTRCNGKGYNMCTSCRGTGKR